MEVGSGGHSEPALRPAGCLVSFLMVRTMRMVTAMRMVGARRPVSRPLHSVWHQLDAAGVAVGEVWGEGPVTYRRDTFVHCTLSSYMREHETVMPLYTSLMLVRLTVRPMILFPWGVFRMLTMATELKLAMMQTMLVKKGPHVAV